MQRNIDLADWTSHGRLEDTRHQAAVFYGLGVALADAAGALEARASRSDPIAFKADESLRTMLTECATAIIDPHNPQFRERRQRLAAESCRSFEGYVYYEYMAWILDRAAAAMVSIIPPGPMQDLRHQAEMIYNADWLARMADGFASEARATRPEEDPVELPPTEPEAAVILLFESRGRRPWRRRRGRARAEVRFPTSVTAA